MDIQLTFSALPAFLLYAVTITLLLKAGPSFSQAKSVILISFLFFVSWLSGLFDWQGATALVIITMLASQILSLNIYLSYLGWSSLFFGPLLLALHLVPGFTSQTIFGPKILGSSTLPYTFNINIDKAMGALVILFAFRYWLSAPLENKVDAKLLTQISIGILALFSLGLLLGIEFDPKFGQLTFAFIFFNLFVTCVAEESFFRLLIQRFLLVKTNSALVSILVTSVLFMLAHFHTGAGAEERLSLIFLGGLIYAWVFHKSRSLLTAILVHFTVNFCTSVCSPTLLVSKLKKWGLRPPSSFSASGFNASQEQHRPAASQLDLCP